MEEVDGMSTGDRGGNAELCKVIPNTKIPIICTCNDKDKDSVKTLSKHCKNIVFNKPVTQQMLPRIRNIAKSEGYKLSDPQLCRILDSCNGDFRQSLNVLQMWHYSTPKLDNTIITKELKNTEKDIDLGANEIIPKLFNKNISIPDKLDLYWMDYSLLPVLMQENYIENTTTVHNLSKAADSISEGDEIGSNIFREQEFSLMPVEALLSCIRPAILSGANTYRGGIKFPAWLGKNSKHTRLKRLLQDIHSHTTSSTLADITTTRLDYISIFGKYLTHPLIESGRLG